MKLSVFCSRLSAQLLEAKTSVIICEVSFWCQVLALALVDERKVGTLYLHTNCPTFWLISFKFGEQTLIPIIQAWRLESWSRDLSILKSESLGLGLACQGLGLELLSLQSKPAVMVHTDTVDHSKDFSGYDLEVLNGAGTESFPESSVICDLV